jgi:uncharacterized protein
VRSGPGFAVTTRLGLLAASMRAGGARVGVDEVLSAHRALCAVDCADRREAYFALRTALCSRREDLAVFDAAFAQWLVPPAEARPEPAPLLDEAARLVLPRAAVPDEPRRGMPSPDTDPVPAAWSQVELLHDKDFAEYTEQERRVARLVMTRLAARGPTRPSRRTRRSPRRGPRPYGARPDLRRTMRSSLRSGGDPVERHWRVPAERQRPLVLICDVSGSMEPYARMLLQYVQACVVARRRVEAFAFGTSLTRVTGELRGRDPDRALGRAARAVSDWSGGTRIGEALAALNREHGRRVGRGATVVILSDGWDRGEPELLAGEMERLARCAHRVVWLNPLKAHPDYEPLTRGMQAALPNVDRLLAGNSLASLEELAELMEGGLE